MGEDANNEIEIWVRVRRGRYHLPIKLTEGILRAVYVKCRCLPIYIKWEEATKTRPPERDCCKLCFASLGDSPKKDSQ